MSSERRVVITGIGIVSAIGCGNDEVWENLVSGKSGIDRLSIAKLSPPYCWGAEVKDFDARKYISPKKKKSLKVMSRDIQLAVVASKFAIDDASLMDESIARDRIGLSLGSCLIDNDVDEIGESFKAASENGRINDLRFGEEGMNALTPLWMLKYLPNMPACHISLQHDLQGPSNTITTEGASSMQAIGEGFRIIQRGSADCMVVGGSDSKLTPIGLSRYDLLKVFPQGSNGSVMNMFRPFDEGSDGFLPGEGAAILVLEEREHALQRKAKIYGELIGYGTAPVYDYDPHEANDSEGRFISMKKALDEAKLSVDDLSFCVPNGNGIVAHDKTEEAALRQLTGGEPFTAPVALFKPQTGYVAAASGALESSLAALAIGHQRLSPVVGRNDEEKFSDLNFVKKEIQWDEGEPVNALIHSSSIVGPSAALVIRSHNSGEAS